MDGRTIPRASRKPLTANELERAWATHREGWLARAANSRSLDDAYSLLDQLSAYADGAKFAMVPYIERGFGMSEKAAFELLADWEVDRQGSEAR